MTSLGPLPPTSLRERVAGTADEAWFVASGAATVDEWRRTVALTGRRLEDFHSILDFGCGCGRALRHLESVLGPSQQLFGCDVDVEAIEWLAGAHPRSKIFPLVNGTIPLDAASMDLVLSHSVFTHLPEQAQFRWLAELARILRVGGTLVTSLHGEKAIREYRAAVAAQGRADEVQNLDEAILGRGFYHVRGRSPAELTLPEEYGAAFHRIHYVLAHWLRSFSLVAWLPTFALGHQDVVVLTRREG